MATRCYIGAAVTFSPTDFNPSLQGSWGADFHADYYLAPAGHGSLSTHSFTTRSVNTNSSAATIGHAICVSPPLATAVSWSSSTDLTCTWRCSEASTSQNTFQQFYWGLISNDGSTVLAISNLEKGATEYSTSLVSRTRTDADCGFSYTSAPGDRLFVEIGWDKDGAVSGSIGHQYGYSTTSGDLVGDGDSGIQNPWCEWSNDFTFDAEGTTYGDIRKQLMLMGVGR